MILLYGGYLAVEGHIQIGVVVAFVGYLNAFFDPIQQISQLYTTYQQGMAALDKIFELLDDGAGHGRQAWRRWTRVVRGEVELDGVWFSYGSGRMSTEGLGASGLSICTCRPGRRLRSLVRPGRASRRSRSWWPGSRTRRGGGCWSTGTIFGI